VSTLRPFIDWGPFFQAWGLAGAFPRILEDEVVGVEARKVLVDAEVLLDRWEADARIRACAVAGLFPVSKVGPESLAVGDAGLRFEFLRQQLPQRDGVQRSLADFVHEADHIGCFATGVHGVEALADEAAAVGDDYASILAKAVGDRLAEALAEWLHREVRTVLWGYAAAEALSPNELIRERYQGIRPAPGYPACPDHEDKRAIWSLLEVESQLGMRLTETLAMTPAAAVSGYYFAHPDARYFAAGLVGADQITDYAARRGMTIPSAQKTLAMNVHLA
jgi:5-methyltetrahydrofolate--homocysteine methyltransferase